jgi:hypothetical protein
MALIEQQFAEQRVGPVPSLTTMAAPTSTVASYGEHRTCSTGSCFLAIATSSKSATLPGA